MPCWFSSPVIGFCLVTREKENFPSRFGRCRSTRSRGGRLGPVVVGAPFCSKAASDTALCLLCLCAMGCHRIIGSFWLGETLRIANHGMVLWLCSHGCAKAGGGGPVPWHRHSTRGPPGAASPPLCEPPVPPQAGLVSPENPEQLLIALEPEAASIYCRKLRLHQLLELSCRAPAGGPAPERAIDSSFRQGGCGPGAQQAGLWRLGRGRGQPWGAAGGPGLSIP